MPAIVTNTQVKNFSFKKPSATAHDALLDDMIEQVGRSFESFCNRKFASQSRTAKFPAYITKYYVDALPINRNSDGTPKVSVTVGGTARTLNSDYYVNEVTGLIQFFYEPIHTQPFPVHITWTGGYLALAFPKDLQEACILQTSFLFDRRKTLGESSISLPDGSESRQERIQFLPEVKKILKKYWIPPTMHGISDDEIPQDSP